MIKDPLTVWNGPFPYDALAPAGITPRSTQAEVEDASFTLMTRRLMNPVTQKAWDELRDVRRRLLADFLLYDVDPADFDEARQHVRRELADPGEPSQVTDALAAPVEFLDDLAGDLSEVTLTPPPPVLPRDLDAFPPQSLIDSLISFDR
ncbi:hypothetical protein [Gandjariella thermophila]|uniref:Uncharacterized protein n=1 Tax=Gandjariella thermophila TaxID=1931992 RepID=A0A4D4JDL6_9PSEU|nr:hypothetical protein [Gandjariella thermophila]GDY31983.1 hypothetical protein GTS_36160 [Gandjariella thermophila]